MKTLVTIFLFIVLVTLSHQQSSGSNSSGGGDDTYTLNENGAVYTCRLKKRGGENPFLCQWVLDTTLSSVEKQVYNYQCCDSQKQHCTVDKVKVVTKEIVRQISDCDANGENCQTVGCTTTPIPSQRQCNNVLVAYQNYALQTGTSLPITDGTWDFALASNGDLFAFMKSGSPTNTTELYVLSAETKYQAVVLRTATGLLPSGNNFEFAVSQNRDVYVFKKSKTATKSTEVHILTAASNYKQFSLRTATALHETNTTFQILLAQNNDVYAIKKEHTGTSTTEVHILSADSNYKQFSVQTGTILHETDNTWQFALDSKNNVVGFKQKKCGSCRTEVHTLDAATNYKKFSVQTGTKIGESDRRYKFLYLNDSIYAVKKWGTGTLSTEVNILPK